MLKVAPVMYAPIPVGQEAHKHRDLQQPALQEKESSTNDLDLLILTAWFVLS